MGKSKQNLFDLTDMCSCINLPNSFRVFQGIRNQINMDKRLFFSWIWLD